MSRMVSFRLRKIDADLSQAIANIDAAALSDLCRDGLRLVLGLRTTKRVEVAERPIVVAENKTIAVRSKPAVFVPQNRR